jgi:mannose-6-phosphate isomerase-like protein (cupin superfamily)
MNQPSQTFTIQASDVIPSSAPSGVLVRTLLDSDAGLRRHLIDLPAASRLTGTAGAGGELWFVISGRGVLEAGGRPALPLHPDRGLLLPPGLAYQVSPHPAADDELRIDRVGLPDPGADAVVASAVAAPPEIALARDLAECSVEITGDRQFRVLFGPGLDCAVATAFVGEIPPGRAPDHSHPYDETVLVLGGQGWLHAAGEDHPLSPGTCTRLPPGLPHCLENTGATTLRVLGVFHPADSPAAKLAH